TATVTGGTNTGSYAPVGTVTFMNGATSIGVGTLTPVGFDPVNDPFGTLNAATATFSTSSLATGTPTITAVYQYAGSSTQRTSTGSYTTTATYSADGESGAVYQYGGSTSNGVSVTVGGAAKQASTTTLTDATTTTAFGNSITFTATVTPNTTVATGTVIFDDGATSIGQGVLNGSGVATFSTSTLSVGVNSHTISAVYQGDANYSGSTSNSLTQTVVKNTTTATLTSSTATSAFNTSVTFTATITSAGTL